MTQESEPPTNQLALAYSAGSTLVGPVLLGLLCDWLFGTLPWLTVVGVFLGMAAMLVLLVRFTQTRGPKP